MKTKSNKVIHRKKQPPWWDNECETAKSNKFSLLHNFRRTNDFRDLQIYKTAKSRFKNLCRSKRLKYEKEKRAELINVSQTPREYWKCIKQNCNKTQNSADQVPSESFVTYFKNLLNVEVTTENDDLLRNITQENDITDLEGPITD